VDMKDKAMLENLVTSAVNQALAEARKKREQETQKIAGGLGLPGVSGLFP
jgi:DNA-binding protein YbaB